MMQSLKSTFGAGLCGAFLLLLFYAGPAMAQGTERLGDFGAWSAFRFIENGNTACYIASQPTKDEGDYKKRGDIYALVAHRPAEGRRDEVSILAGYDYKKDSLVEIKIGGLTKRLFTLDDSAWAADKETDEAMVQAMIKGSTMVVIGTSARGTVTTDTYSLRGFTKAYQAANGACPKK
jgi:hypothetical protein